MRIAVFTDSFHPELGGIQDSIVGLCRALGARGHDILVSAPTASDADYACRGLESAEVDLGPNVQVSRCPSVPVPGSTGQSRLVLPTIPRWHRLAAFAPDVVHTHTFLAAGWQAVRVARRFGLPLVGTNHWAVGEFAACCPFAAARISKAAERLVSRYYGQCDWVSAPSRSVIDEMRASGLRGPATVVSNPIDTQGFGPGDPSDKARLKRRWGLSEATVVYAGRLAMEKNIDVLLRAVALLRARVPDVVLALAGHGSAQPRLTALAAELGIGERVRFFGTLEPPRLAELFRAAEVFAIASTTETQSMAMLQAMSTGLPVVAARWRALPEFVGRDTGLLAEPGQAQDFADGLASILTDDALRAHMARHASLAVQRCSIAQVTQAWEQIYAVLPRPSRSARPRSRPEPS